MFSSIIFALLSRLPQLSSTFCAAAATSFVRSGLLAFAGNVPTLGAFSSPGQQAAVVGQVVAAISQIALFLEATERWAGTLVGYFAYDTAYMLLTKPRAEMLAHHAAAMGLVVGQEITQTLTTAELLLTIFLYESANPYLNLARIEYTLGWPRSQLSAAGLQVFLILRGFALPIFAVGVYRSAADAAATILFHRIFLGFNLLMTMMSVVWYRKFTGKPVRNIPAMYLE